MLPRWMLLFWPSTRGLVDDLIGIVPSNHGTAKRDCTDGCVPALWQQSPDSRFIATLNAQGETLPGISYTNVITRRDTTVTQDVCPADPFEHITTPTIDPVAWALTRDALDHEGPAALDRVAQAGCAQPPIPDQDPGGGVTALLTAAAGEGKTPAVQREPRLRCYARPTGCPPLAVSVTPRVARAGVPVRFTISVRLPHRPADRAVVTLAGHRARTDATGTATLRPTLRRARRYRVLARWGDASSGAAVVRARPRLRRQSTASAVWR